jgi:purine-binding chemotaxis protein CheW
MGGITMTENKDRVSIEEDDFWDKEDEDSMKNRYLTFRVGEEDYGIEIVYVTEIVGIQNITEVPDMPAFVKGVINLRGQVIPVIDVRTRFKLPFREYDDRTCFIVVNINASSIGLIVDTVSEVINIPEDQISPPPEINAGDSARYIQGMGKVEDRVKILLDVQKLLLDNETDKKIENVSNS